LTRGDVEKVLDEGFFPQCPPDTEPRRQKAVGLQELGLPYAADPAVTKHLASFIHRNAEVLAQRAPSKRSKKKVSQPTAVLFNGGVFKAEPLRQRLVDTLNAWADKAGAPAVRVLQGTDLDMAVARGGAYYGLVRRGKGVRIRGGAAGLAGSCVLLFLRSSSLLPSASICFCRSSICLSRAGVCERATLPARTRTNKAIENRKQDPRCPLTVPPLSI